MQKLLRVRARVLVGGWEGSHRPQSHSLGFPEHTLPLGTSAVLVTGLLTFPCIAAVVGKQRYCYFLLKSKYIISQTETVETGGVRRATGSECFGRHLGPDQLAQCPCLCELGTTSKCLQLCSSARFFSLSISK